MHTHLVEELDDEATAVFEYVVDDEKIAVAGLETPERGCVLLALSGTTAHAQQTTGVPGSPDATTTIDGRYIPPPPQKFEGQINLNAAQSKTAWPARVVPPKGAPNILLILTDDV